MVTVKKDFENSEVTYDYIGLTLHVKLADASQEELRRLKELKYEGVEEKRIPEK